MPARRSRALSAESFGVGDIVGDLSEFFQAPVNFAVLRTVNGSAPPISLRALSWFVSNGIEDEDVRKDYEDQLRKYTRRRFDPFRRCDRLSLHLGPDSVTTTIGQMNFFRWMIQRGLWKFVVDNSAKVSAEVARRCTSAARGGSSAKGASGESSHPFPPGQGFSRISGRHVVFFD